MGKRTPAPKKCVHCGELCSTKELLYTHKRAKHPDLFFCPECTGSYLHKNHLKTHFKTHYKEPNDEYMFKRNWELILMKCDTKKYLDKIPGYYDEGPASADSPPHRNPTADQWIEAFMHGHPEPDRLDFQVFMSSQLTSSVFPETEPRDYSLPIDGSENTFTRYLIHPYPRHASIYPYQTSQQRHRAHARAMFNRNAAESAEEGDEIEAIDVSEYTGYDGSAPGPSGPSVTSSAQQQTRAASEYTGYDGSAPGPSGPSVTSSERQTRRTASEYTGYDGSAPGPSGPSVRSSSSSARKRVRIPTERVESDQPTSSAVTSSAQPQQAGPSPAKKARVKTRKEVQKSVTVTFNRPPFVISANSAFRPYQPPPTTSTTTTSDEPAVVVAPEPPRLRPMTILDYVHVTTLAQVYRERAERLQRSTTAEDEDVQIVQVVPATSSGQQQIPATSGSSEIVHTTATTSTPQQSSSALQSPVTTENTQVASATSTSSSLQPTSQTAEMTQPGTQTDAATSTSTAASTSASFSYQQMIAALMRQVHRSSILEAHTHREPHTVSAMTSVYPAGFSAIPNFTSRYSDRHRKRNPEAPSAPADTTRGLSPEVVEVLRALEPPPRRPTRRSVLGTSRQLNALMPVNTNTTTSTDKPAETTQQQTWLPPTSRGYVYRGLSAFQLQDPTPSASDAVRVRTPEEVLASVQLAVTTPLEPSSSSHNSAFFPYRAIADANSLLDDVTSGLGAVWPFSSSRGGADDL